MKLKVSNAVKTEDLSRPARGAWVEMLSGALTAAGTNVATRKGRVG